MKWLITTKSNVNIKELLERLNVLGCVCNDNDSPIPFDQNEQVIEVSGPRDLPDLLSDDTEIIEVCPSSDMSYY